MLIQEAGIMLELQVGSSPRAGPLMQSQTPEHNSHRSSTAPAILLRQLNAVIRCKCAFTVGYQELIPPQDISISALYLSSKLNETPVRLRDLINTYIFLLARINHLLSLPSDQPLTPVASSSKTKDRPWGGRTGAVEDRAGE